MKCIYEQIPHCLLRRCFELNNFSIFSLPDVNNSYEYNYLWQNILKIKLSKFLKVYDSNVSINVILFNKSNSKFHAKNIQLNKKDFISFIINTLRKDLIVFFSINQDSYSYGYIIIPGNIQYML